MSASHHGTNLHLGRCCPLLFREYLFLGTVFRLKSGEVVILLLILESLVLGFPGDQISFDAIKLAAPRYDRNAALGAAIVSASLTEAAAARGFGFGFGLLGLGLLEFCRGIIDFGLVPIGLRFELRDFNFCQEVAFLHPVTDVHGQCFQLPVHFGI